MTNYHTVEEELKRGTSPDVLCATCPWDRLCITPPEMTKQQIDKHITEAGEKDKAEDKMPVGALLTTLMFAGRDKTAHVCPVFALRLRGPDGRQVADQVRALMRGDQS